MVQSGGSKGSSIAAYSRDCSIGAYGRAVPRRCGQPSPAPASSTSPGSPIPPLSTAVPRSVPHY
eukprot:1583657-Rhodomonas_salina.1